MCCVTRARNLFPRMLFDTELLFFLNRTHSLSFCNSEKKTNRVLCLPVWELIYLSEKIKLKFLWVLWLLLKFPNHLNTTDFSVNKYLKKMIIVGKKWERRIGKYFFHLIARLENEDCLRKSTFLTFVRVWAFES